jgi:oxepin-CoA hydrolase/3-oxo-5,6-dehydrosuberyl-CoA semialdehyde dehydrogenase
MAEQSLPPGMVLPASIHGGPGRAGGGEELGGLRGLVFYQQRTALQGFKSQIAAFGELAGTAQGSKPDSADAAALQRGG